MRPTAFSGAAVAVAAATATATCNLQQVQTTFPDYATAVDGITGWVSIEPRALPSSYLVIGAFGRVSLAPTHVAHINKY